MNSLYFKNFLATASMVFLSFFILASAFIAMGRRTVINQVRAQMEDNATTIADNATSFRGDLQSFELRMVLSSVSSTTGQQIFITDENGYIVNCSDHIASCRHIGIQITGEFPDELAETGEYSALTTLNGIYDVPHYVVGLRFGLDGEPLGCVYVSKDTDSVLYTWEAVMPLFSILCMSVLGFSLVLSFIFSRHMSMPLREMATTVRRFGHGEMSVRLPETNRTDEIGELTLAFNNMADSIEQSEKRREEFVANISHELKTPMTTIAGFADGILDGTITGREEKKYLQTISSETKRLSRLVRSMLELSRLQAEDKTVLCQKSFDLAEALRLTLISFYDKITNLGLDVDFQVPEDPMVVLGDEDAITQVIYNLFDNAIKFAYTGTALCISLWKDDSKAYVSVRNRGDTIPADEIPLLFDRFHKSDKSRSLDKDGVGLGLYIVKTILNNHGEDIVCTSKDGITDFVFTMTLKL